MAVSYTHLDVYKRQGVSCAHRIVALVNPQMPRTHGDGLIHTRRFTHMVNHEEQLVQINYEAKTGPEELKIGQYLSLIHI